MPQGVLNATAYFQGVMKKLFAGLNCKVWVDDIVWWGDDADDFLILLDKIFGRVEDDGLFAAAHKCLFFAKSRGAARCTREGQVSHDRKRLSGLASVRRPQTAGE